MKAHSIVAAIDKVAANYEQRHGRSSGIEQQIYGEIRDALQELSSEIERKGHEEPYNPTSPEFP